MGKCKIKKHKAGLLSAKKWIYPAMEYSSIIGSIYISFCKKTKYESISQITKGNLCFNWQHKGFYVEDGWYKYGLIK